MSVNHHISIMVFFFFTAICLRTFRDLIFLYIFHMAKVVLLKRKLFQKDAFKFRFFFFEVIYIPETQIAFVCMFLQFAWNDSSNTEVQQFLTQLGDKVSPF